MKVHQKGFLLQQLGSADRLWDVTLIERLLQFYGLSGRYWENNTRTTLDELAAGGLISPVDHRLSERGEHKQLNIEYVLTDFGRERMRDTGLL